MQYICTLSDKNYLMFGLTLYESLKKNISDDFILYYLCLDDEAYEIVSNIKDKNIKPVSIGELEKAPDFDVLKANTSYNPGGYCTYCFALGSFFTEYVMAKHQLPHLFYIDADIVFYNDFKILSDEVTKKSIGIMLHRHNFIGANVGAYNVGAVYFKNDDVGHKCLKWWRDCTMNPKNEWFEAYGKCADQKYLEAFDPLFGKENISIMDDTVGHGAPWNLGLYQYLDEEIGGTILWHPRSGLPFETPRKQKMVFIHFSHFMPDFETNTWRYDREGEWGACGLYGKASIDKYYNDYFEKLKSTKKAYEL